MQQQLKNKREIQNATQTLKQKKQSNTTSRKQITEIEILREKIKELEQQKQKQKSSKQTQSQTQTQLRQKIKELQQEALIMTEANRKKRTTSSNSNQSQTLRRALKTLDNMDTENRKRSLLNQRDKNKKQIENKKLDILKLYSNNDNIFNVMSNMEDKNKFLEKIEQVVIDNNNKYNYVFNFIKMCSFPVNISNYLIKAYNLPYIVYDEKFTINKNLRTYEINNNTSELFKNLTNIQLDTAYYIDPVSNVTYELFNESMLNIFMDEVINKLPGKDLESK